MKNMMAVVFLGTVFSLLALSQSVVPDGAKVFIASMDGGLDGFIASEIIKKSCRLQ